MALFAPLGEGWFTEGGESKQKQMQLSQPIIKDRIL